MQSDVYPVNFNWAVLLFGSVFLLALVVYVVQGRRVYKGPVEEVRRLSGSTLGG